MNKDIKQCQDVVRMKKKRKFKKETVPQKNQKLKQEIKKEKRKDNIDFITNNITSTSSNIKKPYQYFNQTSASTDPPQNKTLQLNDGS